MSSGIGDTVHYGNASDLKKKFHVQQQSLQGAALGTQCVMGCTGAGHPSHKRSHTLSMHHCIWYRSTIMSQTCPVWTPPPPPLVIPPPVREPPPLPASASLYFLAIDPGGKAVLKTGTKKTCCISIRLDINRAPAEQELPSLTDHRAVEDQPRSLKPCPVISTLTLSSVKRAMPHS